MVPVPVYGAVPPLALMVTEPVDPPLHNTAVLVAVAVNTAGCVMVPETTEEQPLTSVTV